MPCDPNSPKPQLAAASVGTVAERVHGPSSALADVERAYRTALVGRQAVLLSLPLDVQTAPAPTGAPASPSTAPLRPAPAAESVAAVADLLAAAERPVIVAGRGAALADARRPLEALADRVGALLATSVADV